MERLPFSSYFKVELCKFIRFSAAQTAVALDAAPHHIRSRNPSEWGSKRNNLSRGHIFYSLHCTDNNIVYDNSKAEYPVPSLLTLNEMKQKIKEGFLLDMQKAADFREAASMLSENKPSQIVAFFLHQSIELTYRGILKRLEEYDKKTHSLRALRKYIRRSAPQLCIFFSDDSKDNKQMNELSEDSYIKARYDSDFIVSIELITSFIEKIKIFQNATIDLIMNQIV